jgi:hypothetical protein
MFALGALITQAVWVAVLGRSALFQLGCASSVWRTGTAWLQRQTTAWIRYANVACRWPVILHPGRRFAKHQINNFPV